MSYKCKTIYSGSEKLIQTQMLLLLLLELLLELLQELLLELLLLLLLLLLHVVYPLLHGTARRPPTIT